MQIEPPLNLAVWGLGRHALRTILPAVHSSSHLRLAGVCSRNAIVAEKTALDYGCKCWLQAEEMLASNEVDVIYVASPVATHYAQAVACLSAGKHVICEKSLTASGSTSMDLVERAQAADRLLLEAFMYLYHPRFRALARMRDDGEFGNIQHIACHFTLPPLEQPGYRFSAELGGGAFLDAGCYSVSLALALDGGMPEVIYAHFDYKDAIDVDVAGTALFRLSTGGHMSTTWGYGGAYRNEVTVLAEKCSAHANFIFSKGGPQSAVLAVDDRFGRPESRDHGNVDSFAQMFAYVSHAARNDIERRSTWQQTARQATLMAAISASAGRR